MFNWGKPEQASHRPVVTVRCTECHKPEIYIANTESLTIGDCSICCTSVVCPKFYSSSMEAPHSHEAYGQYGVEG